VAEYFLDTSAMAKLYHVEHGSDYVEHMVSSPGNRAVVSRLGLVEIESVIAKKARTGLLDENGQELFRRRLRADLSRGRIIVGGAVEGRHYRTARLLMEHYGAVIALRTLDALQLALALDYGQEGQTLVLVSGDHGLCKAAEMLGCAVIDPTKPGLA
jgi:predicted nucleic acid-binding protein